MSLRKLRGAAVAAGTARLVYAALRAKPPGGDQTWTRTNHRGQPITLLEGPAVALGGIAGALADGGSAAERAAMTVAGAGALAFGSYDDLAGDRQNKGFRGHLGALRHGQLTTGTVKIAGIGATGLAAALIAGRAARGAGRGPGSGSPAVVAAADVIINTALIAGGANLVNLFDLRPGRATKAAMAAGALIAAGSGEAVPSCAAPLAAALALLPEDLGERSMLGDAGANALGAMLSTAAATSLGRPARVAALTAVVGLNVASEFVSFSKIIEMARPGGGVRPRLGGGVRPRLGGQASARLGRHRTPAASVAGSEVPGQAAGTAAVRVPPLVADDAAAPPR